MMKISMLKSISFKVAQLALIVGCLTLGYSTKASAEVNMKLLNSVVKSCQDNPPKDNSLFRIENNSTENCVWARYRYTLFMSKYNDLKNLGDLRPGFPSSLVVYNLAFSVSSSVDQYYGFYPQTFLDCMVSKDISSFGCEITKGQALKEVALVCSSCFEAYLSAGSNLRDSMAKDLINWFYELDKPSRKLVADSLSNPEFMEVSNNEAGEARQLYSKIKEKVDRETQEKKRRELLQ